MQPLRDLAIVLRSVPYEERHKVVTALTEKHGQISALARNCIQSRRFGGALDVFAASEWEFSLRPGAELYSLKEAQIRRGFEGLRRDFERLSQAAVFNELVLKVAPQREACGDLFKLHSNALVALEEAPGQGAIISLLNAYLAKLLQWNGTQPRLESCLGCSRGIDEVEEDEALSCRVADAGWLCASCRQGETHQTSKTALIDFQISLMVPVRQVAQAVRAPLEGQIELFFFLEALLAFHIPGFDRDQLKGLRFLPVLQKNG